MNHEEKLNTDAAGKAVAKVTQESVPKETGTRGIAYQNKDIVCKILAERIRGKDLSVLGLDLPRIADIRPTNLPAVELNELRMDNLFLLEDKSYVLVDYESEYSGKNKLKYMGYIARLSRGLYNENNEFSRIHLVIIYTADVKRGQTDPDLDIGSMTLKLTEVFLSEMDGDEVLKELEGKVVRKEPFLYEDLLKLIVLPLTYEGPEAKKQAVNKTIKLADSMEDIKLGRTVLGLIMAFADKIIEDEDRAWIRRLIGMSQFEQWIEEEITDAVNEAVAKVEQEKADAINEFAIRAEQEKKDAVNEAVARIEQEKADAVNEVTAKAEQEKALTAQNFLRKGVSIDNVAECTGLPIEKVRELAAAIA